MGAAEAFPTVGLPTLTTDDYLMSLLRKAFETASDLE